MALLRGGGGHLKNRKHETPHGKQKEKEACGEGRLRFPDATDV